jgi:cell division protein ZapD
VRSEVLKELERQMAQLSVHHAPRGRRGAAAHAAHQAAPHARGAQQRRRALHAEAARLGVPQRDQAPQHDPGRHLRFDLPDYTHWLNQSDEVRGADFAHWLAVIRPLGDAVGELLWMTREQGRTRPEIAPGGVFHLALDRDVPTQLIRIALPNGTDLYPEISGSHYRCSVRFLVWQDADTHPIQTTEDVMFSLTTCT